MTKINNAAHLKQALKRRASHTTDTLHDPPPPSHRQKDPNWIIIMEPPRVSVPPPTLAPAAPPPSSPAAAAAAAAASTTPPSPGGGIVKLGWLWKKGSRTGAMHSRKWHRRWFLLSSDGTLSYGSNKELSPSALPKSLPLARVEIDINHYAQLPSRPPSRACPPSRPVLVLNVFKGAEGATAGGAAGAAAGEGGREGGGRRRKRQGQVQLAAISEEEGWDWFRALDYQVRKEEKRVRWQK